MRRSAAVVAQRPRGRQAQPIDRDDLGIHQHGLPRSDLGALLPETEQIAGGDERRIEIVRAAQFALQAIAAAHAFVPAQAEEVGQHAALHADRWSTQ